MLARLFLALILAALALPQVAMACHQPPREMVPAGDCHGMTHKQEQPDRLPDLCIGCIAPVTIRPVALAAPLPHRLSLNPVHRLSGDPIAPPPPATPPPRPLA